jgi:hypothetical protein
MNITFTLLSARLDSPPTNAHLTFSTQLEVVGWFIIRLGCAMGALNWTYARRTSQWREVVVDGLLRKAYLA